MNTSNISICIVGTVSVGKSVLLNALFCKDLTQSKIKRTTMVPCLFIENEDLLGLDESQEIKRKISEFNQQIIQKTEAGEDLSTEECQELVFNVSRLDINICENTYTNIYDIPGLNDSRTKQQYYNYLQSNFYKFNVVIFMVDIHSGLNTSDEMDILRFIIENIKSQKEKNIGLLVVINKADDMQLRTDDLGVETLELSGELLEMFEQVKMTVTNEFAKEDLSKNLIDIIPLCAMDSFLYRAIKKNGERFVLKMEDMLKIGLNQMGKQFSKKSCKQQKEIVTNIIRDEEFVNDMIKLSGFSFLEKSLHKYLTIDGNGSKIRIENYLYELKRLKSIRDLILKNYSSKGQLINCELVRDELKKIRNIVNGIHKIDTDVYDRLMSEYKAEYSYCLMTIMQPFRVKDFNNIYTIQSVYMSIQKIIEESFPNLYQAETHEIIIHSVKNIMMRTIQTHVPLNRINQIYQILFELQPDIEWVNEQTKLILLELINNKNMFNTFIIKDESYDSDIKECIESFSMLEKIDRDIMNKYINMVMMCIIYRTQSSDKICIRDVIIQKMIFTRAYEKTMTTLIFNNFNISFEDNMRAIYQLGLDGWRDEYMNDNKFLFEVFYLNYQYKYNSDNIHYSDIDFFTKTEQIIGEKIGIVKNTSVSSVSSGAGCATNDSYGVVNLINLTKSTEDIENTDDEDLAAAMKLSMSTKASIPKLETDELRECHPALCLGATAKREIIDKVDNVTQRKKKTLLENPIRN